MLVVAFGVGNCATNQFKQIQDDLLPFVPGIPKIDVEVPQNDWLAPLWARFPCPPQVVYLVAAIGGDVDSDDVESIVPRGHLEGHNVWAFVK